MTDDSPAIGQIIVYGGLLTQHSARAGRVPRERPSGICLVRAHSPRHDRLLPTASAACGLSAVVRNRQVTHLTAHAPARLPRGTMAPPPSSGVLDAAYDPRRQRLATLDASGSVSLWTPSPAGWTRAAALPAPHTPPSAAAALAWAPPCLGPPLLATVGSDAVLALTSVAPAPPAGGRPPPAPSLRVRDARGGLASVAFHASGLCATFGAEGVVRVYAAARVAADAARAAGDWVILAAVRVGRDFGAGLAFSEAMAAPVLLAGGVLLKPNRGGASWTAGTAPVTDDAAGLVSAAWGAAGLAALGRADGSAEVWALRGGAVATRAATLDAPGAAAAVRVSWDAAGDVLAVAHADGVVRVWGRNAAQEPADGDAGRWPWALRETVVPGGDGAEAPGGLPGFTPFGGGGRSGGVPAAMVM